jgi:DNA polymerase
MVETGKVNIPEGFYQPKCCDCMLGFISSSKGWKMVVGKGNPEANILIVGEAPGKDEAEQGLPFVGRAGKVLDGLLFALGLSLDDVYITNTVMHRPIVEDLSVKDENREPSQDEINECKPYLVNKIKYMKPELIIAMGRTACSWFFPSEEIERGKVYRWTFDGKSYRFLHLYHPAALLYNPGNREIMERHLKSNLDLLQKFKRGVIS